MTNRRSILKAISTLTAATYFARPVFGQAKLHVGVVGSGIVGVSIALHLAQAGAKVTVFEKTALAAGATSKSFAWINGSNTNQNYRNLRIKSLEGWQKLDRELGLGIIWGGAIKWQPPGEVAARVRADIMAMAATNYPFKEIDADMFRRVGSEFTPGDIDIAGLATTGGHLDPVSVTTKLMARAKLLGVDVKMPCAVEELIMSGNDLRGVKTTDGDMALDRLVIASGVDTPRLTSKAGYLPNLHHEPGILVHSTAVEVATNKVVYGPGVHFKQFAYGRIVGADSETPPKSDTHQEIRRHAVAFPSKEIEDMHSQRIIDKIARFLPAAQKAQPHHLTLGFRPMPADRFPILGYLPKSSTIYVAVMHSGVTLAPIVGRMVTSELIGDKQEEILSPFRPDRPGLL